MANASDMNKDQFIQEYEKQRHSFIDGLKRFNSNKGTPFRRIPEIAGHEIDLYHLYQRVTSLGGWQKVNHEQKWAQILPDFGIPKACTNAHEALKQIYFRYLNNYEKVNFLGEDVDLRKNDDEDGPMRKKICLPIESIPLKYNYNQHQLTDDQRQHFNLSLEKSKRGPYDKLELSLQSGLPNEVDMAINVCVLLSTEGKHTTNLQKANNLLPLLLAHVGVFGDGELRLEDLYSRWSRRSKRDFLRFWYESVRKKEIRLLITWKGHVYTQKEMVGEEVLNMGRDLGVLDSEGQRAIQLGILLRNLSFEECNQKLMATSKCVFKFLLLCMYNTYGNLRQLALDTLANLSHEIPLGPVESLSCKLMMNIIHEAMVSQDRFCLVRGLEVLSKVCLTLVNKEALSSELQTDVYSRLIDLLTLQDIQIIVHTLEALYKLSKAGEPFATNISRVHKAIEVLVNLITIEAQSFGPGSLVGIKVVEYVPPAHATEDGGEITKKPTTVIQPVNPDSVNIYQVPGNQLGLLKSANSTRSAAPGAKDNATPTQPKAKETVTDIQTTTSSWLKATYEVKKKSKVNQVELFSDYLQFCRKFGIKNPLSSAEFLQMVKVIFPQSEVLSINRKNGDSDVFFEGLYKRTHQKPFVVTTVPSEKVAKAVNVNVSPLQTPPHVVTPTLRQRLMEPPRLSSPTQFPHSPGISTTARSATAAPNQELASKPGAPVPFNIKAKVATIQPSKAKKRDQESNIITALQKPAPVIRHMTTMCSPSFIPDSGSLNHITQNGINSPSVMEDSADPSCVKSLLAKKLCQTTPVSYLESSITRSNTFSPTPTCVITTISSVTATKPTMGNASCSPATSIMPCPAVTSSQMNPGYRPVYQQGKSTLVTSESWSPQVACPTSSHSAHQSQGQPLSSPLSSASSISHSNQPLAIQTLHPIQPSSSTESSMHNNACQTLSGNSSFGNLESNREIVVAPNSNAQKPNQISQNVITPSGMEAHAVLPGQQAATSYANARPGVNVSMVQPATNAPNPMLSQQAVHTQMVQQSSQNVQQIAMNSHSLTQPGTNVTFVQQRQTVPIIPQSTFQPQMNVAKPVLSVQGSSLVVGPRPATGIVPQQQPQQYPITSPSSIPLNHLIRTPSSVQIAGHSIGTAMATPQQCTTVTQSISSPAVAALLTSNPQQANQMLISTPVQGASQAQMGVPSTMVIQTTPGTFVMPSRQLVLQGNVGTVQQQNQSQQGTVSFVMPPNYRQTPSLIIQQGGGVNMLPSLTLQAQQPLASSLTPQAGQLSGTLGTRQIVINPSSLPVGMQIASVAGNASNICVAPQPQQANLVIQSVPAQHNPQLQNQLQQTTITSNHHPPTMNGTSNAATMHVPQVPVNESQLPRSDAIPVQQNILPSAMITPQQIQNPQLMVQVSQAQQPSAQNPASVATSQMQLAHCNGNISEVNGALGSPDSMSSDLPPSPMSSGGMLCDRDIPNGKLLDSDREGMPSKANLVKFVEKVAMNKLNGFVHVVENGCHTHDPSKSALSSTPSSLTNSQTSYNAPTVPNGLPPESSNNIHGRIISSNNCVNIGLPQSATRFHEVQTSQLASRPHLQQKPVVPFQPKVPQQFSLVAPNSASPSQRPQTRISTLTCQSPLNSGTIAVNASRAPMLLSNSEDSDMSNDSVSDLGDKSSKPGAKLTVGPANKKSKKSNGPATPQPVSVNQRLRKKKGPAEVAKDGKTQVTIVMEYRCEWGSCRRCFATARLVFLHVFRHHIPKNPESCCKWLSCEILVRKRWSLVSHVQDYHCSEMAMRNACQRRFAAVQNPTAPLPPPPPQPMIYPPDAAIQAIRRFAIKPPYHEFAEPREGPVSKHIRLTAALILRNICHHSVYGRRLISRYEQHLGYNTMNAVESSSALSSCLWDILHFGESQHKSSSTASHLG